MNKERVKKELLSLRPDLDIRTDQCGIIRVNCGKLLIGIEEGVEQARLTARAISLDIELDFETQVLEEVTADEEPEIVEKVFALLNRYSPL